MPTIITHPFVALLQTWWPQVPRRAITLGAIATILPDGDVVAFVLGIPYDHMLGHRGLTHSIAFALVVALLGTMLLRVTTHRRATFAFLFLCALSHPLLDALTDGGLGVALFALSVPTATSSPGPPSAAPPSAPASSAPAASQHSRARWCGCGRRWQRPHSRADTCATGNARASERIFVQRPTRVRSAHTVLRRRGRMKTTLRVALGLTLIVAAMQNADAQTTWQPAGGHKQIVLWPDGPPDPRSGVGVEALHYALKNRETNEKKLVGGKPYMYIENVTQPTVTIYPPPRQTAPTPAVIVYPGGGFEVLAIDIEGTEICDWLVSNGIACALLKYRVPCEHQGPYRECPSAHVDAQRAMSIVRSRAAEWRIDPNKIGVIGFSAGAHMAIMASTRFDRLYPAVDDADKTSSRPDFALVLYPGRVVSKRMNFAPNPDIQPTDRTPPSFLVHAFDDPMNPVEGSLAYAAALRKAGVPSEIHIFANGGHAFGLRRIAATATAWAPLAEAWLKAIGVIGQ